MRTIKIASGQGFWGDWLEAPVRQVRMGEIDYLMLDYLAEVTMSILSKQKKRNPELGYAKDFVDLIQQILPDIVQKNIRVLANAGGVNPRACAEAILNEAERQGYGDRIRVAIVEGDDLVDRIDELIEQGEELRNIDTGEPISSIRDSIESANAYLGCEELVNALDAGADIIVTGRVADAALALAPMVHEFGWKENDWDKRAAGIIAGHAIECGAQASGGNCSFDWRSIPDLANIGFPIVEMREDGVFWVYKHDGTGGRIDVPTVSEQLIYEIGDPRNYIVPDVIADFTSITLEQDGVNRVRIAGAKGKPHSDFYKVSTSYLDGYTAFGTMVYSWPDAADKARAAGEIVLQRLEQLNLPLERIHTEIVGLNSCHGELSETGADQLSEAMLRVAVHSHSRAAVKRFTREIAPLVLSGPPSATGYAGGKRQVQEVMAYWPTLIPRNKIQARFEILNSSQRMSG
jgi:hypothetical protein